MRCYGFASRTIQPKISVRNNRLVQLTTQLNQAFCVHKQQHNNHKQHGGGLSGFQLRCMNDWAREWSVALNPHLADTDYAAEGRRADSDSVSATPTPHPAPASSREAIEWEAVLTAAEAAGSTSSRSNRVVPEAAQSDGCRDAFAAAATGCATSETSTGPVHAVIECGSHCTRLLISTHSHDVVRLTQDTHLGASQCHQQQEQQSHAEQQQQGHAAAALLQPSSIAATLKVLQHYSNLISQHQVLGVAAVATAAVRQAANANEFVTQATAMLGHPLQVLSGDAEGQLAFQGATASLAGSDAVCLVFDLGGRSTEFAVGVAGQNPNHVVSLPLGCFSIQPAVQLQHVPAAHGSGQSYMTAEQQATGSQQLQMLLQSADTLLHPHSLDLQQVLKACRQHRLTQHEEAAPGDVPIVIIGTGGTLTTLAALHQQLLNYDHNAVHMSTLKREDIVQLAQQLVADDGRWHLQRYPWLTTERASSLLAGCAGVLAVMKYIGASRVVVSDCDLLDGLLMRLKQRQQQQLSSDGEQL